MRGGADPSHRLTRDGRLWRATRTPSGSGHPAPAGRARRGSRSALGRRGRPGRWTACPDCSAHATTPPGFEPQHPVLGEALARRPGWRVPRTGLVMEALVPTVVEQKVTGQEAFAGWRRLLTRFGEVAPGPGGRGGHAGAPSAAQWAAIPSWERLQAGVDGARSATVVRAGRSAGRLEQTLDLPGDLVEELHDLVEV